MNGGITVNRATPAPMNVNKLNTQKMTLKEESSSEEDEEQSDLTKMKESLDDTMRTIQEMRLM